MSLWDDPSFNEGNFVKLSNAGDSVTGKIVDISLKTWDDGKKSPSLKLRGATVVNDGVTEKPEDDVEYTAGPYRLKIKLAELRPNIGDDIYIKLIGVDKLGGGKTANNFEVRVKAGQNTVEPKAADPFAEAAGNVEAAFGSDEPPF